MAFVLKNASGRISTKRVHAPGAPGAVSSPQIPGQVPDRSDIPGEGELPVAPVGGQVMRPLSERGTSQYIMGVYAPRDGNEDDPARFEQATVSYEEARKAHPALRTPLRPMSGYALADGTRESSDEIAALTSPGTMNEVAPGE